MAWVKIPKENHPLLIAALPKDKRVVTIQMFGGLAGLVNGNMFGGLFGRSVIVKLSQSDQAEANQLDGTAPFDPMGNGHVMADTLMLPETVMDEPNELRMWMTKAFEYVATLPPKAKKAAKKPAAKSNKPAKKSVKRTKSSAAKPAKRR